MTTTREAGAKRWRGVSKEKQREISSKGGKAAWASMTEEERSAEMKRRARVRAKKRKPPRK